MSLAMLAVLGSTARAVSADCGAVNCNDSNPCTTDSCIEPGTCVHTDADGAGCSDGNVCTVGDTCGAGVCQPGTPLACNDSNACTDDTCNPVVGCVFTKDDMNACDDGSVCTSGDHCSNRVCVGTPVTCPDDGNVCTSASCNPVSGCGQVDNTASCDDGDACTVNDRCAGGVCGAGSAKNCSDANPCTTDTCDSSSGLCGHEDNTTSCDDGDLCTVGDACAAGTCQAGAPRTCDDANACTDDSCLAAVGCVFANDDANACTDDDACTSGDHCASGACTGAPVTCPDDGNVCTSAACSPATGCAQTFNTASCDDGDACTLNDVCSAGTCQPGAGKNCDDAEICTADSCVPATGACEHAPNTMACSDGDPCTTADVCTGGTCQSGPPLACDDGNPCTDDGCSAPAGCEHVLDDTNACSDADLCTSGDHCASGACVGDAVTCPDDGDVCTAAVCDPATGCGTSFTSASCDDDDACTTADHCVAGTCVGTTDVCAACPAQPSEHCTVAPPRGSALALKDAAKAKHDALSWKWRSPTAMTAGDLGDPTSETGLRLCVYDQTASLSSLVLAAELPPGGTCGRRPCWKLLRNGVGFKRAAAGESGGAAFRFKSGATKAGFAFTASGPELAMPPLPLRKEPRVIVELHRTDEPTCWAARYGAVKSAKTGAFKAVSE